MVFLEMIMAKVAGKQNNAKNNFENKSVVPPEEKLEVNIEELTSVIISTYLIDHKLFQEKAEKKITNALKKISKEKTLETLAQIKQLEQIIINFSGQKIRLVENLSNSQKTTEIIEQLNATLLDLTNLLDIDFDKNDGENKNEKSVSDD